jgi:hypothetical protein
MNDELTKYLDLVRAEFLEDGDVEGDLEDWVTGMVMVEQCAYPSSAARERCEEILAKDLTERFKFLLRVTMARVDRHLEEKGDAECALDPYKAERERRMRA